MSGIRHVANSESEYDCHDYSAVTSDRVSGCANGQNFLGSALLGFSSVWAVGK